MERKRKVGDQAPDFQVTSPWSLNEESFWKRASDRVSILFFLRYYGCLICQLEIKKIRDEWETFSKSKLDVYVIIQSKQETMRKHTEEAEWPFQLICDPDANIYDSFQVSAGNVLQFLHPSGLPKVVESLRAGNKHGKLEGKETQMPAVFGVDAQNQIIYSHYGRHISDLPDFRTIINSCCHEDFTSKTK